MSDILSILKSITDLVTPCGITFTGYFVKPSNNICFFGRVKIDDLRKLNSSNTITLSGKVNEQDVYIQSAEIIKEHPVGFNSEWMPVHIFPWEIVIGVQSPEHLSTVVRINAVMPELNWFFPKPSFASLESDKITFKFPEIKMSATCYGKQISLARSCEFEESASQSALTYINNIELTVHEPIAINQAINELACIRYFFCFLADDGVPLPSSFSFCASGSGASNDNNTEKHIWLNDNHTYRMQKKEWPFRIRYDDIKKEFNAVLNKRMSFWKNKHNHLIIELFNGIICMKSIGLNRFLNLCQALEVYSTQYRNAEAKHVWEADKGRSRNTTLYHRLIDIFCYHNDVFQRSNEEITEICRKISDARNYYTHYTTSYREKYDDIRAICMDLDSVLHFLLLATVYKEMGIQTDVIQAALQDSTFRFGVPSAQLFECLDNGEN